MPTPEIDATKAAEDKTPTTVTPIVPVATVPAKPVEKAKEEKAPETKPAVTVIPPTKSRQIAICERMGEIIAEHGGLVSNIPAVKSHEYWALKAELDAIRNSAP